MKNIILASKSPRRKELLEKANIKFNIVEPTYKENLANGKINSIKKISYCKAQNVAERLSENAVIISADTVVILDSVCLVKPQNFKEAFSMLKKLSNRTHKVITAVTVIDTETKKCLRGYETTKVKFKKLEDKEIEDYINNFKPYDKAGSYGIQDFVDEKTVLNPPNESFIKKISGSYDNVMGLPVGFVLKLLDDILKTS